MPSITPNLNLYKPDENEYYDINLENSNMDRIDSGYKKNSDSITSHTSNLSNPHKTTAAQVGAYTKAEIDVVFNEKLNPHLQDFNNPHKTTAAQVGAYTKEEVDAKITGDIGAHIANKNNPHATTKAQVGLGNVPNYPSYSGVDSASNEHFATAGAVKTAYDKAVSASNSASSHIENRGNPHGVTTSQIGALSTNGGTVSGSLVVAGKLDANGSLSVSGWISATDNITAYSDKRLKTNLNVISNPIEKVAKLTGYTYDRIDTGNRETGIIAQDLLEVLPEAVREDENGILSVAYGNVIGLLIESIKELKSEITALKEGR